MNFARQAARLCCAAVFTALAFNGRAATPSIEITNVPPFGSTSDLGGRVLNANPADYRVAVLIYIPGAGWWSKPFCNPQLTTIQANGSWTADITTGGSDANATTITALLVTPSYSEACVTGLTALPSNVLAQAVASATVTRADPGKRRLNFCGYDWWLKSSAGPVGPGPNHFSDSTNNVWLDAQGRLHLRITNRSNQWQCAEIVSARTFGYGSYRFEVASDANTINLSAVLGLFTWSDDPAYTHREIDVECSRWGNAADANNAQFVVQPWDTAGHLIRYPVPGGLAASTHLFTWETNRVTFRSQRGSYSPNPGPAIVITNWTYSLDVPQSGNENVRLNLWLFNGVAPVGNQEVECVVKSFQFVPLGTPRAATLTNFARLPTGQVRCDLLVQADRRYQMQMSTNLTDWQALDTLLATNSVAQFQDTHSVGAVRSYFRAVTLP
jgi:hypothetical protein